MYTYEPFGKTIEELSDEPPATSNWFMFTGQYLDDEIDEYYLRARMYDPYISRFTSRDPVTGKFEEPLTLHAYLYCGNEPVDRLDPWGLASVALFDPSDGRLGSARWESADDYDWYFSVRSADEAVFWLGFLTDLGEPINDLYIFDHGYRGGWEGRQQLGDEHLYYYSPEWRKIASTVEEEGTIHLRGCYVAEGNEGKKYIMLMAMSGRRKVDAFNDLVRHPGKEWPGADHYSYGNLWLATPEPSLHMISEGGLHRWFYTPHFYTE